MSQVGSYIYLKSDLRSRPLWGIYISILKYCWRNVWEILVLVPYGVSTFLFDSKKVGIPCMAFSSPMRYLHFYSRRKHIILKNGVSSRPLWGIYVSILQEWQILERIDTKFSSPMGYLHFYFGIDAKSQIDSMMFSSPMGYLYFYST